MGIISWLWGVAAFVMVIGVIVLFHEAGHFIAAKAFGMTAPEFAIGFGPVLFSFTRGGTRYAIRALPVGGFVRIIGMDPNEDPNVPGGFSTKSVWARLITLTAGCTMNFVLAILIFCCVNWIWGIPIGPSTNRVEDVQPGSPAALSGLQENDRIVRTTATVVSASQLRALRDLNARNAGLHDPDKQAEMPHVQAQPLPASTTRAGERWTATDVPGIRWIIEQNAGHPVTVTIQRGRQQLDKSVVPRSNLEGVSDHVGRIGIVFEALLERTGPLQAIKDGLIITWRDTIDTLDSIPLVFVGVYHILTGHHNAAVGLGGPLKIAQVVSQQTHARMWLFKLFLTTALLSINIGILNLIPFPALDGSRIAFQLIELLGRGRIDPRAEASVHYIGIVVLLIVMAVITVNDIITWSH